MDEDFMININFKEGTIRTNREPRTEEERIRLRLVEQDLKIRDMMHKKSVDLPPEER